MKPELSKSVDTVCQIIEEKIHESNQTGHEDMEEGFEIHNNYKWLNKSKQ